MLTWHQVASDPRDAPFLPRARSKTTTETVTGNDRPWQQPSHRDLNRQEERISVLFPHKQADPQSHTHTHKPSDEEMQMMLHNLNTICVLISNQHSCSFFIFFIYFFHLLFSNTCLYDSKFSHWCYLTNCAVWQTPNVWERKTNSGKTSVPSLNLLIGYLLCTGWQSLLT